jgi:hypothetical protein
MRNKLFKPMISPSIFTLNFNYRFASLKLIYVPQNHISNFPVSRIIAGPTPFLHETGITQRKKKKIN